MPKISAGILLYRYSKNGLEVLLVHLGGPFWVNKDLGSWTIPTGLNESEEELLQTAQREFEEETGFNVGGEFISLGKLKQPSGKIIHAWALEGNIDAENIKSNTFSLEWPKHSGQIKEFPEVDRGSWFDLDTAHRKITKGQQDFLDRLAEKVKLK